MFAWKKEGNSLQRFFNIESIIGYQSIYRRITFALHVTLTSNWHVKTLNVPPIFHYYIHDVPPIFHYYMNKENRVTEGHTRIRKLYTWIQKSKCAMI